ncbi:hypothetical protein BJV77DRAFT_973279 [Russula vinacea]|nr:hypothetical protein BJV77DRAFT_973279 [Russula vinacea]
MLHIIQFFNVFNVSNSSPRVGMTQTVSTITDSSAHPQTTPNQPLQGEPNFGNGSRPLFPKLFPIYSKAAEEENNTRVERRQKDVDCILILSLHFSLLRCDHPGPGAKQWIPLHSILGTSTRFSLT